MGEGAAAAVLATQPNRKATGHEAGKGQVLTHAPVEVHLALAHGTAVVDHLLHQRMQGEAIGHRRDAFGQTGELCLWQGGVGLVCPFLVEVGRPVDSKAALVVGENRLAGLAALFHG